MLQGALELSTQASKKEEVLTLPCEDDAREMWTACNQGNLDEVKRLYERFNWEGPVEECEELIRDVFDRGGDDSKICRWLLHWIEGAANGNHLHVLQYLLEMSEYSIDYNFDCDPRYVAIAKVYLDRMRSPCGTVEDVLMACGKGWWSNENDWEPDQKMPYEQLTCWHMEYEYDREHDRDVPTVKRLEPVKSGFVPTDEFKAEHPDIAFFTHCTPEHIAATIKERMIVPHVILLAYECFASVVFTAVPGRIGKFRRTIKAPDYTNGSRFLQIAETLVDMGFEFDNYIFFLMDDSPNVMRPLMHKMIQIHGGREYVECKLPRYDAWRHWSTVRTTFLGPTSLWAYAKHWMLVVANTLEERRIAMIQSGQLDFEI